MINIVNNKIKKIITALIIVLVASVLLIICLFTLSNSKVIEKNTINAEIIHGKTHADISLYKEHPEDEERFLTPYMFPGDGYEQEYRIKAYYKGTISLFFRVFNTEFFDDLYDIRYNEQHEVIAEYGPRIKVVIDGEEKFDGLIKDIPEYIVVERQQNTWKNQFVTYDITMSLDKEVSSDYTLDDGKFQDKEAYFDMEWWVEGGDPYPIPPTGVDGIYEVVTNPTTYVFLICVICIGFLVFMKRRRKDYE